MALNIDILVTFGGDQQSPSVTTLHYSFSQGQSHHSFHIASRRAGGGHYESVTEIDSQNQAPRCH